MGHQTARKRRRARGSCVIVLALFASATAACGARWTDEQRSALLAREQGGGSTAAGPTGGTSAVPRANDRATGGGSSDPTGGSSTGAPDAVNSPTAGSPGEGPEATGPRPCAQPSDAPGVSDTQITIGSISSRSGPVPGLGETAAAAARAYVAFRNANGGVCGRELVLREADDRTDNAAYRQALQELAPEVLGLAGGIALGDAAGADLVEQFGIPIVNTPSVSSASRWIFDVNPDYPRPDLLIGKYKYLYEQGARTVAMAYLSVDSDPTRSWCPARPDGGGRAHGRRCERAATLDPELRRRGAPGGQQRRQLLVDPVRHPRVRSHGPSGRRHRLRLAVQGLLLPNLRHPVHRSRGPGGRGSDGVAAVASHRGELTKSGDGHLRGVDEPSRA